MRLKAAGLKLKLNPRSQIGRGERRIQQKHGRSHQNGRPYSHQENKKSKQIGNSNNIHTQRQRPKRMRQEELGG